MIVMIDDGEFRAESELEYWTKLAIALIPLFSGEDDCERSKSCEKIANYLEDFQNNGLDLPAALKDIFGSEESSQMFTFLNKLFSKNPKIYDVISNFLNLFPSIDSSKAIDVFDKITSKLSKTYSKISEITEIIDQNYETHITKYVSEYDSIIKKAGSGSDIFTDEELHNYQKLFFVKLQSKRALTKNMSKDFPILHTILEFLRGNSEASKEKIIPLIKKVFPQILDYVIILYNMLEVMDQQGNLVDILNQIPTSFINAYETLDNFCLIEKSDLQSIANCITINKKDQVCSVSFVDLINLNNTIKIIKKYADNKQDLSLQSVIDAGFKPEFLMRVLPKLRFVNQLRLNRFLRYVIPSTYPIVVKRSIIEILEKSQKDLINIEYVNAIVSKNKRKAAGDFVAVGLIAFLIIAQIIFSVLMLFIL